MSFPAAPDIDDEVTVGGRLYRFDGDGWRRLTSGAGPNPLDWVAGGTAVVLEVLLYAASDFNLALSAIDTV